MWPFLIDKAKQGGIDTIETYVFWNAHEPQQGLVSSHRYYSFFKSNYYFSKFFFFFFLFSMIFQEIMIWSDLFEQFKNKGCMLF